MSDFDDDLNKGIKAVQWVGAIVLAVALVLAVLFLGCVTRVQVCTTYDHRIGKESYDKYARDSMGTSVCADIEPSPIRLQREYEEEETSEAEADAGG